MIQKIRYSHDAMIDMIIANPWMSQGELANQFGYTESWTSLVMSSDAFAARLAERRAELIDPTIAASIEERFKGLAIRSLAVLQKKLENPNVSDATALRAAELGAKALGMGNPKPPPMVVVAPDRLDVLAHRLTNLLDSKRGEGYEIKTIEGWSDASDARMPNAAALPVG